MTIIACPNAMVITELEIKDASLTFLANHKHVVLAHEDAERV